MRKREFVTGVGGADWYIRENVRGKWSVIYDGPAYHGPEGQDCDTAAEARRLANFYADAAANL